GAGDADNADGSPASRRLARLRNADDAADRVGPSAPSDRELHEEQREDDHQQAQKIEGDEGAAPVRAHFIRELPDAPQADGRADRRQQEAGAARPSFGPARRNGRGRGGAHDAAAAPGPPPTRTVWPAARSASTAGVGSRVAMRRITSRWSAVSSVITLEIWIPVRSTVRITSLKLAARWEMITSRRLDGSRTPRDRASSARMSVSVTIPSSRSPSVTGSALIRSVTISRAA